MKKITYISLVFVVFFLLLILSYTLLTYNENNVLKDQPEKFIIKSLSSNKNKIIKTESIINNSRLVDLFLISEKVTKQKADDQISFGYCEENNYPDNKKIELVYYQTFISFPYKKHVLVCIT